MKTVAACCFLIFEIFVVVNVIRLQDVGTFYLRKVKNDEDMLAELLSIFNPVMGNDNMILFVGYFKTFPSEYPDRHEITSY